MAYSEFNYLRPAQLPTYIHTMSSVTDETLAVRFISDAERIIDAYVGPWPRFHSEQNVDLSTALASGATVITSDSIGDQLPNYWARGGIYVVVSKGPAALIDEARLVVASVSGTLTLASGFAADLPADDTVRLRLEQRSVFPRHLDVDVDGSPRLPDELARAVAWQVEYGIEIGSEAFGLGASAVVGQDGGVTSRTYASGYSESRDASDARGLALHVAPKVRTLLRRLVNTTGYLCT